MRSTLPNLSGCAGAAFLLRTPVKQSLLINHPEGLITVRKGAPLVTVELKKEPLGALSDDAWRIVQEALDIHAAVHRQAIGTQSGGDRLNWKRVQDQYLLSITDSARVPWAFSAHGVSGHSNSTIPDTLPAHHPSFRFYRLSQLSEDLFDAYRNAYLALEYIVSDVSPKGPSESEANWLKRVLNGPLANCLPGGLDVEAAVDDLYNNARLPLFHAKAGKSFYLPQGTDRSNVQAAFELINAVLASVYRSRLGVGSGGWARLATAAKDAMARAVFSFDEVRFSSDGCIESVKPEVELVSEPRRDGQLWARVSTPAPASLQHIDSIELWKCGELRAEIELEESIPLANIAGLNVEIRIVFAGNRAPNPSHAI